MYKILGLTGKTGAGKSTVSKLLADKGAFVIDADIVARQVLSDDGLRKKLAFEFGSDVLTENGVDRKLLASRAFKNEGSLLRLNSVMHPAINQRILDAAKLEQKNSPVVIDGAAIIESGCSENCDALAVVYAPENVRLERIVLRDGITSDEAELRMKAQKPDGFYSEKADFTVRAYEPFSLEDEIMPLIKFLFGY